MHSIGGVATSDTERFAGYHRTLGSQNGEEVIHTGSLITSLNDDVDIKAKGAFHQTSSQIVANNRVDVTGKSVTFDAVHNTTEYDTHQSDLKIGQFTRVISPIIDLIQSAEQLFDDKEASDRVKAARMLALAAQGYTLNNTVQNALDNSDKAVLFRVESGTGMSRGRNRTYGSTQDSVGNVVNGLHVNIVSTDDKIKATHTDFVSRDDKGNRRAGSSVVLDGKKGVELLAGESTYSHTGKNQHYGTEVGTAFSAGGKFGWSFYAKEGFGKGEQVSEGKTHQNSHIDTDHFTVKSDGDVLMKGATSKARVITTEIGGKLHIESQQDEHRSKQSQFGLNSKVEFGIGSSWEFSGNANAEGGNSHSKQVKEQSGLFAEERYSVEADSITLVGGAIASNTPGNSTIRTNNIAFSDIENSSDYSAASGSISGGYSQGGGVSGGTGVPMYDGGKDKTLTKATITNGTIILNKDTNPTETTAEALGINTDLSQANKQVEAPKEVGKLVEDQKAVQESAGHISKAAETYIARQQKEILKQEADTRKEAEEAGQGIIKPHNANSVKRMHSKRKRNVGR